MPPIEIYDNSSETFNIKLTGAVFIGGFAIWLLSLLLRGDARAKGMAAAARDLGFVFRGSGNDELTEVLREEFGRGGTGVTLNVLDGVLADVRCRIFDHVLIHLSRGRGTPFDFVFNFLDQRQDATYALFEAPRDVFSAFEIGPKAMVSEVGTLESGGLESLEGASSFRTEYYLKSFDLGIAKMLFTPRVLEFFAQNPGWSVEGKGKRLLVYRGRRLAAPEEIRAFIEQASAVFKVLLERG